MSTEDMKRYKQIIKEYNEAIFNTDRALALKVIQSAVYSGISPEEVVFKVIIPAIDSMVFKIATPAIDSAEEAIVGGFEVNLAQQFIASQIAEEVVEKMIPLFKKTPEVAGRVIIGTSRGDFHELGKQILIGCLRAMMFDVIDLGLNVPPERFVDGMRSGGLKKC